MTVSSQDLNWLIEFIMARQIAVPAFDQTELTQEQIVTWKQVWEKIKAHVPVAYVVGEMDFYKHTFFVDQHTLIPRQDSEIVLELGVELLQDMDHQCARVIDVGTGSGCLAVSLADLGYQVEAWDISAEALVIARKNAVRLGAAVEFYLKDMRKEESWLGERVELIISNPPYISSDDVKQLDASVREYEPVGALDGGCDGLDYYRSLAQLSHKRLGPGGYICVEIGWKQLQSVRDIFCDSGKWRFVRAVKDLAGHPRALAFALL